MSRNLTSAMAVEVAKPRVMPIMFVEGDFADGFARVWSGRGEIVWDAKVWSGVGHLLAVGEIEETREIEATTTPVTLSGIDPTIVSLAYGSFSQGRAMRAWLGMIDQATFQIVQDPQQIMANRMDTIGDADSGDVATITVSTESNLADLQRVRARFYTDQDQQRWFPGDRSLRYIPSLQDRNIFWGTREGSPRLPQSS